MVGLRLRFILALVVLLPVPSAALAQGDQRIRNAINNVHQEMMACAAYYNIFAACLAVSNEDKKTEEMKKISRAFLDRGSGLAKEIGLTADAATSRFKLANEDQLNLINKNCVNISSLISRYQERCFLILEDVKAVLNEYMK